MTIGGTDVDFNIVGGAEPFGTAEPMNSVNVGDSNDSTLNNGNGASDLAMFVYLESTKACTAFLSTSICNLDGSGYSGDLYMKLALWGTASPDVQVPEPATLAILGLGLLGFGVARRLRAA